MKRFFAVLAMGLAFLLTGCGQINEGHVGVRTEFGGKIDQKPLGTGFYMAVLSSVDEFTAREVTVPLQGLRPKAQDNLTLEKLDLTIYYRAAGDRIPQFASERSGMSAVKGGIWLPGYRLVQDVALGTINDAVSKFPSLTLHTQREALEHAVRHQLQESLNKSDPGMFTVTRVVVTAVDTDQSVENSIRERAQADMRLQTATKEVEIREQQAKANEKLTASLTPEFLKLRYIDAISECAKNTGCTLVVDSSSSDKILNLR